MGRKNRDMGNKELCKTRYPILLVHGIGFRDGKNMSYWGRIPKVLAEQGAVVYNSRHDGWGSIEHNAGQIVGYIKDALEETGAEKINLIGHSKGGLDSRYLASMPEMADKVASVTTISTPHHGSKSMDFVLKIPKFLLKFAGLFVNAISWLLGDKKPDFYKTCTQMSTKSMGDFNEDVRDKDGVYYQSYGAAMSKPSSDLLMMVQNMVVKAIEGENDGLVTPVSATWGEFQGIWTGYDKRGVSHADVTDLRRRNFTKGGRECSRDGKYVKVDDISLGYIEIVSRLKELGC